MKARRDYIGTKFVTNEGEPVEIIDYVDKENVLIKFLNMPSFQSWSAMCNISSGQIKFPFKKTVYDRGFYGDGVYRARINNIKTPQYVKWFSMFHRCYNDKYQKRQPTYVGCEVHPDFFNFQNFGKWYDRKIYKSEYALELDKDLLFYGNKIYSPQTCCFVPKEINSTINSKMSDKETMKYLYEKYKKHVPQYISERLYCLAKGELRL